MAERDRWRDEYGRDEYQSSEGSDLRRADNRNRGDWQEGRPSYGRGRDEFGGYGAGQDRWGSQERDYASQGEYGYESQPSRGWREDDQWSSYGRRGGSGYGAYSGRDERSGMSRGYRGDEWMRRGGSSPSWGPRYGRGQYASSQYPGAGSYGGRGSEMGGSGPYGAQRPGWYGSGQSGYYGRDQEYRGGEERGLWDRASDEVSSWFGDEGAERRRQMDKHRGKGPKNYVRSEERIREDVSDRLSEDWRVDASEIEVTVSGSEVTLTGYVLDRDQRRRAEDIAESVSGVTHVQNNIRVRQSGQAETEGMSGSSAGTTAAGNKASQSATQNRSRTGT